MTRLRQSLHGACSGACVLLALITLMFAAGCHAADDPTTAIAIEVSREAVLLPPVSEEVVTATVTGTALDAPVTWTSSAPTVATVRDDGPFGVITGISEGTTTVYALLSSNHRITSKPITVTVMRVPALTGFTVDTALQQLIVGDSRTLALNPVRAASRATVIYSFASSNPAVATVDATTGTITGIAPGTATVTATATASGTGLITTTLSATAQILVDVIQTHSRRIGAGSSHTCALKSTGQAFCWGSNAAGQLGDETFADRTAPVAVAGGLTFTEISGGYLQTCALAATNSAYCWGSGSVGRLGTGDTITRTAPARVVDATPFSMLETGGAHACALTFAGDARCWGWDVNYQLGDFTQTNSAVPVSVKLPGMLFTTISAGQNDTCAVTTTRSLYCWGMWNGNAPVLQAGGAVYATVAMGRQGQCALTTRGQLACAGGGQGRGLGGQPASGSPRAFVVGYVFRMVVVGDDHGCALTLTNDAYCWGFGGAGQLGAGVAGDRSVLTRVSGGLKFLELTAGEQHTCGLTTSNQVYCWGGNPKGQLGVAGAGALVPQLVPFTP